MASLKEKLEKVFTNSTSCIKEPVLEFEETPTHKLSGIIVSNTFSGMEQIDRQNKIWDYMERVLQPDELLNIVSLVTVTLDEANISES